MLCKREVWVLDRRKGFLDKLVESADLPGEVFPGQPLLEIVGDRRALIENHCGVTEYSRQRIGIRVGYGLILVSGEGLELTRMSKEQLIITGRIDGINLCRR